MMKPNGMGSANVFFIPSFAFRFVLLFRFCNLKHKKYTAHFLEHSPLPLFPIDQNCLAEARKKKRKKQMKRSGTK